MEAKDIRLHRLYDDLAYLWPLISSPDEYAEEAAHWRTVLREALGPGRHPILELGAGGGHNLSHLTSDFEATAVDISERMLAHSRRLNPGIEHIVSDMRTVRIARKFKAVLVHDAIGHMLSEADLLAVFGTAAAHLEPGGVFLAKPDWFRETFRDPYVSHRNRSGGGMELTYLEYGYDPDPSDETVETVLTYIIRVGGRLRVEHDRFVTGIFPKSTWARLMTEAGFAFEERSFRLESTNGPYVMLVGRL